MRRLLFAVLTFAILFYLGLSWVFSSVAIVYRTQDGEIDPDWLAIYAPEWDVPLTETVEITSGDNTLIGDFYDNPADNNCGVVIVHGIGGERGIVRQFAPLFWELGCDVLSYDFAPRNNDVFLTYGYTEKDDLTNVIDWFAEYRAIPISNIGVWGASYGAATTLQMLPQQPDLAWVIVDSPYASMSGILREQARAQFGDPIQVMIPGAFFMIEQRAGIDINDVSPVDAVADVSVPILLIHSLTDDLIDPENSQDIYDNANAETTRLVFTDWGAEHVLSYYDDKEAYREIVYTFLNDFAPDFGNQANRE